MASLDVAGGASAGTPPPSPGGAVRPGKRHGARHPAGAEEDWELSSDEERAAAAAAVAEGRPRRRRGGAAAREGAAAPGHARSRSLPEIEGYPTFGEDLPALLDLVSASRRQGALLTSVSPTPARGQG
jgi:hypothetical protein